MKMLTSVMAVIAMAGGAAGAQQVPSLTRADVFAIFGGPPAPFETLMKELDAAPHC